MEALLSVEKAAETLGISSWTVRAYLKEGKLHPVRIGRRSCCSLGSWKGSCKPV